MGRDHRGGREALKTPEAINGAEKVMKCWSCGSENPEGKKFCGDCGKELVEAKTPADGDPVRTCTSCGRALEMETNVCPYCGHWVKRSMFG